MKTYTLEELRLAQAKCCRIEYKDPFGNWVECLAEEDDLHVYAFLRIHPADEWKARLPRLKEGAEWCCKGTASPMGFRPRVVSELVYDRPIQKDEQAFSSFPVPFEFLHPDEIAKQPEAAQAPDFGEPWKAGASGGINYSGDFDGLIEIISSKRVVARFYTPNDDNNADFDRIIACVNALAGVHDPAEFVRQAKEAKAALKELADMPEYDQDDAHRLRHKAKSALTKLQPFIP